MSEIKTLVPDSTPRGKLFIIRSIRSTGLDGSVTEIEVPYASHYRRGGIETVDKIEAVADLLGKSGMVSGAQIADIAHAFKYFDRAGLKDDYEKDIYKCADWSHRLITGKFLNEVEDESGSGEK